MEEVEEVEVLLLVVWEPEERVLPDREIMEETAQVQDGAELEAAEPAKSEVPQADT